MKEYSYTVIFEPLEEGGYEVIVPALPEIVTYGRTLKEAKEMAVDAMPPERINQGRASNSWGYRYGACYRKGQSKP